VIHLVLLSGLVLNDIEENVDRGFAVLGHRTEPVTSTTGDGGETVNGEAGRAVVWSGIWNVSGCSMKNGRGILLQNWDPENH
jgi:hypothetical protein